MCIPGEMLKILQVAGNRHHKKGPNDEVSGFFITLEAIFRCPVKMSRVSLRHPAIQNPLHFLPAPPNSIFVLLKDEQTLA